MSIWKIVFQSKIAPIFLILLLRVDLKNEGLTVGCMKRMKRSCQICECCHAAVVPPFNCQWNCCCCWTRPAAVSRLQATVQHQDERFRTSCFNVLTPIFMLLHSLHMHVLTSYIAFFCFCVCENQSLLVTRCIHLVSFVRMKQTGVWDPRLI